jgi:hypothetical protein
MGADLIGHLMVGPAKLDSSKREEAIKRVVDNMTWAFAHKDDKDLSESDEWKLEAINNEWIMDEETEPNPEYAEELVDGLLDLWPFEGRRTTVIRQDPYNQDRLILFTGEMSWGDSPDTDEFRIISVLAAFEALEIFNIR